jgi:uncharacterized membrane protein YfcA
MEWSQVLIAESIIFCAAFVQGSLGFGLGMIAVPTLLFWFDSELVIPAMVSIGAVTNAMVAIDSREHVSWAKIRPLLLGGAIGIPIGAYALTHLPRGVLQISIGFLVAGFVLFLLTGSRIRMERPNRARFPIGLSSGILGAGAGIGGPPVVLYLSNLDLPKQEFRADIAGFFLCLNLLTVIYYIGVGNYTLETARFAGLLILGVLVGAGTGILVARRLSEARFRMIALVFIGCIGLFLSGKNIAVLMGWLTWPE